MKENDILAFPNGSNRFPVEGMTLRDYFAAKAMQGLIYKTLWNPPEVARISYEIADVMLKERNKEDV